MSRLVVLATMVAVVILAGTIESELALDGHGRLVVIGASPWEVNERCGAPTAIDEVMTHLPPCADDPTSHATVDLPVPLQQSMWTDNVGSTRVLVVGEWELNMGACLGCGDPRSTRSSSQREWSRRCQGRRMAPPSHPFIAEDVRSEHPPRRRDPPPKRRTYAGLTTCLRCDRRFSSWDRRQHRLCPACREAIEEEPSDEPSHTIHRPQRQPRETDDQ